jgi:signal recognition particle receptor subunit beta
LVERPLYREHVRGYIPIKVQNYIWEKCYKTESTVVQALLKCQSPISDNKAEEIVNDLSSNQQLLRELRYWMSTMRVVILIAKNQLENGQQLRQAIQAELNRDQHKEVEQ